MAREKGESWDHEKDKTHTHLGKWFMEQVLR